MEKTLKLFLKPFIQRSDEEQDSLYEFLKHQSFLKLFFPDSLKYHSLFLKLCILGFSYKAYLLNQIVYNSFESHQIFFILSGKAHIFSFKRANFNMDLQNFSLNLILSEENIAKINQIGGYKVLEKGESFGAFSREIDNNILTLVICSTHLELLSLDRRQYSLLFLQIPDENQEKAELISRIFPDLSKNDWFCLSFLMKERDYERNSWIFKEGEISKSNTMYLIKRGNLRVYKNFKYEKSKKMICLSEIGIGELIGFEGILLNESEILREYSIRVSSLEGLSLYEIDLMEFNFLRKDLRILGQMFEKLANMKKTWLMNRIELIENSIVRKETLLMKPRSLSPKNMQENEKPREKKKDGEVLTFGITFIKKVLEKHLTAFEIIKNRNKERKENDNIKITEKKTEIKTKNENKNIKVSENNVKILPKIFDKFDKFIKERGKKNRTLEEFKAEIHAQIKEQKWNFDENLLEKKIHYSPLSKTQTPRLNKSPLPKQNKTENDVHMIQFKRKTHELKKLKLKRWKSPL